MAPAHEGLGPLRRHGGEVEDRLVLQEELVSPAHRLPQVHFQTEAILDDRLHLGSEDDEAVLAGGLGLVQGHIGVADQFLGALSKADRDPDAHPHAQVHRRGAIDAGTARP